MMMNKGRSKAVCVNNFFDLIQEITDFNNINVLLTLINLLNFKTMLLEVFFD